MKKFLQLALVGALVLGVSSVVYANVCAFDPVPAATLLWPFVALDYNNPINGTTTIFAVTNVSWEAQIVHFTLWTDDSYPVLDWNVVLSGYDVEIMNIRDILIDGDLPNTGTTGTLIVNGPVPADDGPVAGSRAPWIQWTGVPLNDGLRDAAGTNTLNVAGRCPTTAPGYPNYPIIPQTYLDLFQSYLQATQLAPKRHADCAGNIGLLIPDDWFQLRDETEVTWMYITADIVWSCNKDFPNDPASSGYWTPATAGGEALYDNVLFGDVFWVNSDLRFSEADNAVHIEADVNLGVVATPADVARNPISFYYRYSIANGYPNSDFREPLPTAWGFRYMGAGVDGFDTWIRAWKGSTVCMYIKDLFWTTTGRLVADDCIPYTYYAWDLDEDVITVTENPWSMQTDPSVRPNLLPLETQEVEVDQFNTPDSDGWMLFVWPASNFETRQNQAGTLAADLTPDFYQTWMGVKYAAFGDYSAARSGIVIANYNCFSGQVLPVLGVDFDYVLTTGYTRSAGFQVSPTTVDCPGR